MGFEAIKVATATKDKFRAVNVEFPRIPLAQVVDAVADGWSLLTPKQRDACIKRREAVVSARRRRAEPATA